MSHKSDSQSQRDAERYMLSALSAREGIALEPETLSLEPGIRVALDGFNRQRHLLCEAYAHIGRTRGAQNHKIARDILKLAAVERVLGGTWRKILCFSDPAAMQAVNNKSWLAAVARTLGIEAVVVPLSPELQESVACAQKRQVMVNPSSPGA